MRLKSSQDRDRLRGVNRYHVDASLVIRGGGSVIGQVIGVSVIGQEIGVSSHDRIAATRGIIGIGIQTDACGNRYHLFSQPYHYIALQRGYIGIGRTVIGDTQEIHVIIDTMITGHRHRYRYRSYRGDTADSSHRYRPHESKCSHPCKSPRPVSNTIAPPPTL